MGKKRKHKTLESDLCSSSRDFRRLRPEDIAGMMRIEEKCFTGVDRFDLEYYISKLEEGWRAYVVGFPVRAVIWIAPFGRMLGIVSLATLPRYRRRGYADMLVEYAIALMRDGRYSGIKLEVRASNKGAIKLYLRHGFKKVKRKKNYYNDWEDALGMCRKNSVLSLGK